MPYAVFCLPKKKNRAIDPPCLDPLSYGRGNEPDPHKLLRRGRVALFPSKEHAEESLRRTLEEDEGAPYRKDFAWTFLECENTKGMDSLVKLVKELDAELDGVRLPATANAIINSIRRLIDDIKDGEA